jgi:serine/threonine protein kinase
MSDERWLDVAGAILDGSPVAWDTLPSQERDADRVSAEALRLLADVADAYRTANLAGATRWGPFDLMERLGTGAFGVVYRARDMALDRDVALKLLDRGSALAPAEEGRLLARVQHPNVVTVHGAAEHDGRYGIWMEFVRGETLADIVESGGPLRPADAVAIGRDVCRALDAVHAGGLLHGDVKAQNVMREGGGRIVLMDFGTGRLATDALQHRRLAGTPLYLAPEVLRGQAPDVRADVYGAGVLCYHLLTGEFPVVGKTLDEVSAAHAARTRVPLRARRSDLSGRLASSIDRATSPDRQARFESAAAFERALAAADPRRRAVVRARTWWSMAAVLLLAAGAAFSWRAWMVKEPIAFHSRDWVLLATFDNRTGDRQFDHVIEYALEYELGNSAYVNVVPRVRVDDALRLMARPPDTVVDSAIAPEVAQRDGGIRLVVDGAIEHIGTGYAMTVRVVDPKSSASIASDREVATTPAEVSAAVRRLSSWVRVTLGEAPLTVTQDAQQLEKARTPSPRAIRLYTEAIHAFNLRHLAEAQALFGSALTEDPNFASAHIWMAWTLLNFGKPREVYLAEARRAVDLAGTSTDRERFWILGSYYQMNREDESAIGQFEALVRRYPDDFWSVRNLSVLYAAAGRPQDALALTTRIADLRPHDFFAQAREAQSVLVTKGSGAARTFVARAEQVLPTATENADANVARAKIWVLLFPAHDLWVQRRAKEASAVLDTTSTRPEFDAEGVLTLDMLGRLRLTLGQLSHAEQAFERITDPKLRALAMSEVALARDDAPTILMRLGASRVGDFAAVSLLVRVGALDSAELLLRSHDAKNDPINFQWAADEIEEARGNPARVAAALTAGATWTHTMTGGRAFLYSETLARAAVKIGDLAGAIRVLEETSKLGDKTYAFFSASSYYWLRTQKLLADLYRQTGETDKARAIERDLLAALAAADDDYPLLVQLKARGGG